MRIPRTAAKEGATPPPLSGTGAARESSIWYAAGAGDEANAHWRPHMDSSRGLLLNGLETVKVRDKLGFDQNYAVPGQRVSAGSALFDRASDPSRIERLRRLVSAWPRTVPQAHRDFLRTPPRCACPAGCVAAYDFDGGAGARRLPGHTTRVLDSLSKGKRKLDR